MRAWAGLRAFLRRVACTGDGCVRSVWKLILAYALYAVWAHLAARLFSRGFGALFDAWGLTSANLAAAPGWAQMLVRHYGSIVSVLSSAGTVLLAIVLLRWFARISPCERPDWKAFARGGALGALVVCAGAGLFLWTDSMRLRAGSALSWELLPLAAVFFTAALAEGAFARMLTIRTVGRQTRPIRAYAASVVMFFLIAGGYALGVLGAINMLLMGAATVAMYVRMGPGTAVGFRFAWSFFSNCVFGFPGGNVAANPVLSLYGVSEDALTGGSRGLICGLWMTLALLGLVLWLCLPAIRAAWNSRRAKPSPSGGDLRSGRRRI